MNKMIEFESGATTDIRRYGKGGAFCNSRSNKSSCPNLDEECYCGLFDCGTFTEEDHNEALVFCYACAECDEALKRWEEHHEN